MVAKKHIATCLTLAALMGLVATVSADFTEDFSGDVLKPVWNTIGNGHTGLNSGSYQMTDASDKKATEIYRTIQDAPSGSFETSITATLVPFTSPNTKTACTWNLNGKDSSLSVILNSFGKLDLRHNDFDGKNVGLATIKNIGYTDGAKLILTLKYNAGSDTLTALYSIDGSEAVEIYSGTGIEGGSFDDFASLRSTVKLYKFYDSPADQVVLSIDKWSMTSAQSEIPPQNF